MPPRTATAAPRRRSRDRIEDHVAALEAAAAHLSPAAAARLTGVIETAAALLAEVARSRAAQGLPATVEDAVALAEAAAALGDRAAKTP